jgi:Leucine-rich repeat (LRR) protein
MSQQPSASLSIPMANQQSSLLISTIPKELFALIASSVDTESQLKFARTSKIVYTYHKQQYKEQTFTLLSKFAIQFNPKYAKLLERCMSQICWSGLKITLNVVSIDFPNNWGHPIKALALNESFELPNGVDYKSLDTLLIFFGLRKIMTSISFEKLSNLRLFGLDNVTINDDIVSILSNLPLLKIVALSKCTMTQVHLSNIFTGYANLENFVLCYSSFNATSIEPPPQLKRFEVWGNQNLSRVNLSLCTQLQSL